MKPFKSREELFEHYKTSSDKQWLDYIDSLTTTPSNIQNSLYHISTQPDVSGVWEPRNSGKNDNSNSAHPIYGEMLPDRISVSETIEGCWAGIFSSLTNNDTKIKQFEVYLYEAVPLKDCKVLTPNTLSKYYLVQDAHLTGEYCLMGKVQMTLVSKLTLKNTFGYPISKWINGHPYNESRYGRTNYPPVEILNNEPINQETNMSAPNQVAQANNELLSLGIASSDLSGQPQTFKGIAKKLLKLSKLTESDVQNMSSAQILADAQEEVEKIKEDVPEWVFTADKKGDGRVASDEQKKEASVLLDELEDFINNAPSLESLMDIQFAIEQGNILMQNQFYKLDKIEDYEYNMIKTHTTSQAAYTGVTQLGLGIESALPDIGYFTQTPSPVNYGVMKDALEKKKSELSKVLGMVGSAVLKIVFVVVAQILVLHLFNFINYWVTRGVNALSNAAKRRKSKKTVNVKRLKETLYKQPKPADKKQPSKQPETPNAATHKGTTAEYFDLTKYTVEEVSLETLYRDAMKSRLVDSNLDDLYKAASSKNISELSSLWDTLQDVLHSVQQSIKVTTQEVATLKAIAPTEEAVVDPDKLKASLETVHVINSSFTKYDNPSTDFEEGVNILHKTSKIFKKGDVTKFDAEVKQCKAELSKLDELVKSKADDPNMTAELKAHFARRIYLLRVASDYLTKNINLQIRFQKLLLGHISLFEKMGKEAEQFEAIIDEMKFLDDPKPA